MRKKVAHRIRIFFLTLTVFFIVNGLHAQAFDFNSFFSNVRAITFFTPDSNNMIYDELHDATEMSLQLDSILPFYTKNFYGAYPNIKTADSITFLPGLHEQLSNFDDKAAEIKGDFSLNGITDHWFAYYKRSVIDTTTAIVIFPGSGYHESFQIANNVIGDYHNLDCLIKDKDLNYGDVYVIVKPNEDFRSIWTDVGSNNYFKLNYDVMGPYTDFAGKNWAANLYIELLAQLKYLQSKYKRVIVMGLSNGGFPALVCGLEAGVDGINCAAGLSVTSYIGFPTPNYENPYFSGLFAKYTIDTLKKMIAQKGTKVLFSYGRGDCCTNAYEYNTHALQDSLNVTGTICNNAEFFYDFLGHTFPCEALEPFFTKVIRSPRVTIERQPQECLSDSVFISIKIKGTPPFSFDLYKNDSLISHYDTKKSTIDTAFYASGEYYINNLLDANNEPLCRSSSFIYSKVVSNVPPALLILNNPYLIASPPASKYYWYKDNVIIDSGSQSQIKATETGSYFFTTKDPSGCIYRSNTVVQTYPVGISANPNPATDAVNILLNFNFTGRVSYTIFDNMGRKVASGTSRSPNITISTLNFARGLYNFTVDYIDRQNVWQRKSLSILKN